MRSTDFTQTTEALAAGGAHGSVSGQLPGVRKLEALSDEARSVLAGCLTELHKTTSLYSMDELRQLPCRPINDPPLDQ